MNYNDLLDFLDYYKQANKDINPGTVLGQLVNNVVDKDTGTIPYFYLNENGRVRIAKNDGKNFQPTQEMQRGHAQILENLKGEDSETWMNKLVGALGGERQFSTIDDWNTNHLEALKNWNLNGRPSSIGPTINDLKKGYSFEDSKGVRWTISNINEPDPTLGINRREYHMVDSAGNPGMYSGDKGAQTILNFNKVEDMDIENIDALEKLQNLGESIEIYRKDFIESGMSDDKELSQLHKEKLDNAINEYLELEPQIQENFPDYKRGRVDSIIQEFTSNPDEKKTEQTVNDTSEQYDTQQETKTKQTQQETKQESGPKMEIEDDGSTKVRTDSNGNEMYTFEDLQREAEERRRQAQEKNGGNTSSENTKSYDGNVNNPYYENDKDIWNPEAGSKEKLEEALNTKPPGKDEVIYENGDTVVMGRDPFENIIDESLEDDDILMEQQMGSRDNIQKEHSRQQQEEEPEPEQINVNEEEISGDIDFDSDNTINEEVDNITKNTNPEEVQTTFEDEIDQIGRDLADGNISSDEAHKLVDEAYEKHKDSLDNLEDVVNQEQKKVEKFETEQAKETGKERPTFEDVVENAKEAREVNQEKPQYNKDSNPQYNQQHPTENLNKEKKPQTTEEVIENAKKQRRKAQRKKGDGKPQYNQQEPYTKPPQVKAKEKTKKPQVNPEPKFEDSTIDLVNKNHEKNKEIQPKTVWQQIKDTYKEIRDTLIDNRKAKSKKVFDVIKRGGYEELNVRTSQGRVSVIRNRKNGEIYTRTFASTGKKQIQYEMGHGRHGRIAYERYRDADSGFFNYLRKYDKLPIIGRWEHGNHIPTSVENPITGEKTITKQAEDAFKEAGEIVKKIKGDQWTEMDESTFNFDVEKERDKFRNPQDGQWEPEKYTKEEREFLDAREQSFKDELDIAEEEWQGFKENNKGRERKIKNKVNSLQKQLEDPNVPTAQKDKIRKKLAQYEDRLENFQNQKKALKDRRKQARQDWNNRNTEGKINQELKNLQDIKPEGVDVDKFYEQYEKLKNVDVKKLDPKAKYKHEDQLKRAEILKKKIEETSVKEAGLEKLKKNVLKSRRSIENMSPGQIVKEIGVGGVISGLTAVGTYKDNRREGRSVLSSAVRAGADFVLSETLGAPAYMAIQLVKEAPDLAVKGAAALFKETRRLNSSSRLTTFGDASFQDTQQLATMRQSGMELAKMSQYRLEQTLMGNEAKYLHR